LGRSHEQPRDEGLGPALVSLDDNQVLGFIVEQDLVADRAAVFVPSPPSSGAGSAGAAPSCTR
jgi:hypothetical protein